MKIADRIAALEALVAQQTAALAEANARLAARPTAAPDPFVLTRHTHRDPSTGSETTYVTLQNRTGEPITLPAGHEIAFFENGSFALRNRVGTGCYLKPTRDGVKAIPAKAPAAPAAPAASAPEAPF